MNYREAVLYLDSFINYERIGYYEKRSFKLERMRRLARAFGNPEKAFPSVHITGTKGKGSTASFIATILKEAGLRVGLYTSPHLATPRERIKINNNMIEKEEFARQTEIIKDMLKRERFSFSPTFFEIYTLLAFNYFKSKKIDYAVVEVGLGGRLDATNIIDASISVITPISYDHTKVLGKTLAGIAREKSGIIKEGASVISAPQEKEALDVIKKRCSAAHAKLFLVGKDLHFREIYYDEKIEVFDIRGLRSFHGSCSTALIGAHQLVNATCAAGVAEILQKKRIAIPPKAIKKGIELTKNPGRCEIIGQNPQIMIDGAQNASSAEALYKTLQRNLNGKSFILVLGISRGKDIKGVCQALASHARAVIITKSKVMRAEEPAAIKKFVKNSRTILTSSVGEAIAVAKSIAGAKELILITGSFFVTGEAKDIVSQTLRPLRGYGEIPPCKSAAESKST